MFIPGKAIKIITYEKDEKREEPTKKLTELLNEYLTSKCIPIEMSTSRLFCINKEPSENGNLDKIRPIAISSFFIKIIEAVLF